MKLRTTQDATTEYRSDGSPPPLTKQQARLVQRVWGISWRGFVTMRLRRAGQQIVLVQISHRWPHRLTKHGVVARPRSTDLIPGMRLTDPMGHRAVVLEGYPSLLLQWQHHDRPQSHEGDPDDSVWHADVPTAAA